MHIDARTLAGQTLESDLCIIGAGPAGISLAREFMGQGLRVALLESGGLHYDRQVQALADGTTVGAIKPSIEVNRRQFGGNANVWCVGLGPAEKGLRHAMFDEIDFQPRPWIAHSGWPIERAQLMGHYRRAQQMCGGGIFGYTPEPWEEQGARQLPLEGSGLETGMFQFSPFAVFTHHHRQQLLDSSEITVYTHATATALTTPPGRAAVSQARLSSPGHGAWQMRAKAFVLAAGGYENARLMLLSRGPDGLALGNQHDLVGRYYHDHLQGRSGYLIPKQGQLFDQLALYDLRLRRGAYVMGYLKLSAQLQAQEKVANVNCFLFPRPAEREDRAIEAFNILRQRRLLRPHADEVAPALGLKRSLAYAWQMTRGLDYVARMAALAATGRQASAYGLGHGGWSQLKRPSERFVRLELWHSIEQTPQADNRVTLGHRLDALGCPELEVHWQWHPEDIDQTLRAQALFARGLERAGLGRVERVLQSDGSPHLEQPAGSHHLMGTTRMHADPRQGVVDAQCRVHGIDNLYVAGSSTFPAGGYANPTLTLVALALRLADHLKTRPDLKAAARPAPSPTAMRSNGP